MHCAICDKDAEEVTHCNTDCSECQEVIYDTLAGYGNHEDEDEINYCKMCGEELIDEGEDSGYHDDC